MVYTSDNNNSGPSKKKPTARSPSIDSSGRRSGNFSRHKLGKTASEGQRKMKYTVQQCRVFCANRQSKIRGRTIKFANSPPCACRGSAGQKP